MDLNYGLGLDETGCGWVARIMLQKRAGLGLGLLCWLYLIKEHSSISDWSIRELSFVGETFGGDLVRLGYGEGRGAEEGWAGVAVAVGVGNRNKKKG